MGRLPADGLEAVVKEFIGRLSQHPDVVKAVMDASNKRRAKDRPTLAKEVESIQRELERVRKQIKNCLDIAVAGGMEVVSENFKERVNELEQNRQKLTVNLERKRHALLTSEAALLDQKRVVKALARLSEIVPKMPFQEQKELFRLFVERIDVRRASGRAMEGSRLLDLKVKMQLPRLVEGMEERVAKGGIQSRGYLPITLRGVAFDAQVDFTNAVRGEVSITAPFVQTVRLGKVVSRLLRETKDPAKRRTHQIHEVIRWKQKLDTGRVVNQAALARDLGMTRAAVTLNLRLLDLVPEIREFLLSIKTAEDVRRFSLSQMRRLAQLPPVEQVRVFSRMCASD